MEDNCSAVRYDEPDASEKKFARRYIFLLKTKDETLAAEVFQALKGSTVLTSYLL